MYPPSASGDYMKPPPKQATTAPSGFSPLDVSTGIPVNSGNHLYNQNPMPAPLIRPPRVPWSSGLWDCCSDVRNCCITCWCPCITFGQISEIVDKGSSSCGFNGALYALIGLVTGCACCFSCFYRSKMRQQYLLRKTPCNDCLVHCFCETCALCQEYRELTHRGYDMSIGWHGNVEMRNREMSKNPVRPAPASADAPPVQGSMTR